MRLGLSLALTRIAPAGEPVPVIRLSASTVAENASSGSVVGALSVLNGSGSYTFTITADPDSKFAIDGANLETAAALNYEAATSHSVTIEADNGVDDPITRTFTIAVTNVAEAPTFSVHPIGGQLVNGELELTATSSGDLPITYQWQKDSVDIPGATSATYTATEAGDYRRVDTNSAGSTNSNAATVTAGDAIDALLAGMAAGEAVKLNTADLDASVDALFPRTQANFDREWIDSSGATEAFSSDTNVEDNAAGSIFAFGGAAIATDTPYVMKHGGGHTDNLDSGVYGFDPVAAAASINGGGSGGAWELKIKSATYKLFAAGKPAYQPANDTVFAAWQNVDEIDMPPAVHSYAADAYLGNGWFNYGGNGTFQSGQRTLNAGWICKPTTGEIELRADGRNGGATDPMHGFARHSDGACAWNPADQCLYNGGGTADLFSYHLYRWENVLTGTPAMTKVGGGDYSWVVGNRQILIDDPAGGGKKALWQHRKNTYAAGGGENSQFIYFPDIENATDSGGGNFVTSVVGDYPGNTDVPWSNSARKTGYCWDAAQQLILVWDGGDTIWSIDPVDSFTIAEHLTITGDVPDASDKEVCAGIDRLDGKAALLMCVEPGDVYLVKLAA